MSAIIFECKKCGTCCRNLVEDVNGIINGLFLTSKETRLFPSKLISPKIALGVDKPKKTVAYQLNVNVCPHINERNKCRIYDKRPLACKSFPFEIGLGIRTVSVKCPQIGSKMKEGEYREVEFSEIEYEASQKISRYLLNRYQKYSKKGTNSWKFDLKTRKWVRQEKRKSKVKPKELIRR